MKVLAGQEMAPRALYSASTGPVTHGAGTSYYAASRVLAGCYIDDREAEIATASHFVYAVRSLCVGAVGVRNNPTQAKRRLEWATQAFLVGEGAVQEFVG